MKNVKENIKKIIDIIGIILIVTGIIFLISLFFSPTFPFWRIMIAIVPLFLGILIRTVNFFVFSTVNLVKNVGYSIKTIKQDINNNTPNKAKFEPFKNNSPKSLILSGIVCSLFAIMLTCLLLFVFNKVIIPSGYVETNGIITDVVRETHQREWYYVQVVEYEVNDKIYTTKSNWKSSNEIDTKTIGTEIVIYYNVDNPEDVIFKNAPVIVNVLAIIIDITFGMFSVILITFGVKKRKEKHLNVDNYA